MQYIVRTSWFETQSMTQVEMFANFSVVRSLGKGSLTEYSTIIGSATSSLKLENWMLKKIGSGLVVLEDLHDLAGPCEFVGFGVT